MELIKKRYETSKKAVARLHQGVERFSAAQKTRLKDEDEYFERRDSLVKRFELAFDTCWKYGKIYLEVKAGVVQNFPKAVFRELLRVGWLTEEQVVQALEMVDARNQTTHTYDDEFAEKISSEIPAFCTLLEQLLNVLNLHQR